MAAEQPTLALKARWVLPVDGPPISGGIVTIAGNSIVAIGKESAGGATRDLGDVALLPGLVNAHTHLEFSQIAVPLSRPGMPLPDWIREVMTYRGQSGADSNLAIGAGIDECIAGGATAIGEIATSDWCWPETNHPNAAPDVTQFRELIGPTEPRATASAALGEAFLASAGSRAHLRAALSPHAPYTVHTKLLESIVELSRRFGVPLAMHLGESREELELLATGSGPFRELLEQFGSWDPATNARYPRILDYLRQLALAPRALVVHGNYLAADEIAYLAAQADRMSLVYCPRTHAFFGHDDYPLAALLSAGVSMALGTDSRASNPDLSLLAEMQFVARRHPRVAPEAVLRLGTLGGAQALGLADQMGTLTSGKRANLAVVSLAGDDPYGWLFDESVRVRETWIDGQPAITAGNS